MNEEENKRKVERRLLKVNRSNFKIKLSIKICITTILVLHI